MARREEIDGAVVSALMVVALTGIDDVSMGRIAYRAVEMSFNENSTVDGIKAQARMEFERCVMAGATFPRRPADMTNGAMEWAQRRAVELGLTGADAVR